MKRYREFFIKAILLIVLSTILYSIHYCVFGQFESTMYYTFLDIAFIPVNILIVTLVFDSISEKREKQKRLNKLNMLIGLFFNEMGCAVMKILIQGDKEARNLIENFDSLEDVERNIKIHNHAIDIEKIDLESLENILINNRDLIINLIGNPNILEHESFAELLMAVAHLRDEIVFRKNHGFEDEDKLHLTGDIMRVYKSITLQWVGYLKHLEKDYPYLYNAAISINPYKNY